jgi:phospholipid/cholesterol/gamma-HCH transport system ATP-binding protein
MGMLFQNGALLTDLSVFENVAFPLREHTDLPSGSSVNWCSPSCRRWAARRGEFMPSELSGGMSRRVALARAIVMDPEMLITTSPSSASIRFRWASFCG